MKAAASTNASSSTEEAASKKPERSPGQRFVDKTFYGIIINSVVFASSIAATYLTRHGYQLAGESKSIFADFARWMNKRGTLLDNKLVNDWKLTDQSGAENFRMVAFSFIDGSIFAMLARPLESLRTPLARWYDKHFAKQPVDEKAYENEPKQSLLSVFGGRVATFALVFPTYLLLNKLHVKQNVVLKDAEGKLIKDITASISEQVHQTEQAAAASMRGAVKEAMEHDPSVTSLATNIKAVRKPRWDEVKNDLEIDHKTHEPVVDVTYRAEVKKSSNLNNFLFEQPGKWLGEKVSNIGWVKREHPKLASNTPGEKSIFNLPGLFEVGFFEAFYTSVCTIGLYLGSRLFASKLNKKNELPVTQPTSMAAPVSDTDRTATDAPLQTAASMAPAIEEAPRTRIHDGVLAGRQATQQQQLAGA